MSTQEKNLNPILSESAQVDQQSIQPFPRSQKVYVQDKLRLKAEEIWTWLQQGAYLYICGDGNKMAKDVHQALLDIAQQAGLNAEQAEQYFDDLRQAKRYQKDVY